MCTAATSGVEDGSRVLPIQSAQNPFSELIYVNLNSLVFPLLEEPMCNTSTASSSMPHLVSSLALYF